MKKLLLVTLVLLSAMAASAQKNTPQSYIEQFKEDAIRIMHETGVPASIVLGVAMHESGCGNRVRSGSDVSDSRSAICRSVV